MDSNPDKNSDRIMESPLGKVALDYIHHPLLQNVDKSKIIFNNSVDVVEEKNLQVLLDNSNSDLRMYGTAEELAGNLKVYQNFPLNHRKFNFENKNTIIENTAFRSFKGETFYCKQYYFSRLRATLLQIYRFAKVNPPSEILEYLEKQEERLDGCYELARYDHSAFEHIMDDLIGRVARKYENIPLTLATLLIDNEEHQPFTVIEFEKVLEILHNIINSHPFFLPYHQTSLYCRMPFAVRVFEDGSEKFVMKSELFKWDENKSLLLNNEEKGGFLNTMDLSEVFKTYRNQLTSIEFVRTPITRAKHAAVPIVTSTGDHCILAADALLEILRRLISALNIFQMNNSYTWSIVTEYMSLLEIQFPSDMKCKYFINLNVFNKMKAQTDKFWENYEREPVKSVRDIGKDRFTVEDLKDELNYLGLTDVFPESTDYAEDVYTEVDRVKKEDRLRTCDMFDALEQCQLICILNRFPNLKKLLHTQKVCHRITLLECDTCPIQIAPAKFKDTKWKEYKLRSNTQIKSEKVKDMEKEIHWTLDFFDGLVVRCNYNFFSKKLIQKHEMRYFLMDEQDLRWAMDTMELRDSYCPSLEVKVEVRESLYSLENFLKCRPTKKIYIRSSFTDEVLIFTDEVLEIIPIVLKQQGTPINSSDYRLEKYRKKWMFHGSESIMNKYFYKLIDLEEFEKVLEEFDIDKRLITIVPDAVHKITATEMHKSPISSYSSVFAPNGTMVMSSSQAVFYIFQSVVYGFNWSMDYCEEHPNCINELKTDVLNTMRAFASREDLYASCDFVEDSIKTLKEHCTYKKEMQMKCETIDYEMKTYSADDEYPLEMYKMGTDSCKLPVYDVRLIAQKRTEKQRTIPVWVVRMFYLVGWADSFIGRNNEKLHTLVMDFAFLKIPMKTEDEMILLERMLNSDNVQVPDIDKLLKCADNKKETLRQRNNPQKLKEAEDRTLPFLNKELGTEVTATTSDGSNEKVKTEPAKKMQNESNDGKRSDENKQLKRAEPTELTTRNPTQNLKEFESTEPEDIKNCSEKTGDSIQKTENDPSNRLNEMTSNESKCCSKCFRTSERCIEAKKELKTTQNKLKNYETKAKRTEELEKTMKEMTKEMEKLKKNNTQLITENEELKLKISMVDEIKEKLKAAENDKKITEEKCKKNEETYRKEAENMKDMIRTYEQQEILMKKAAETEQINNSIKQSSLEDQLSERDTIINEVRQINSRISIENEEYEKTNQMLLDRLSSAPVPISSNQTSSHKKETEIPGEWRLSTEAPSTTLSNLTSSTRSEAQIPGGWRFQLVTLQKIKDTIRSGNSLKHAKEMVEKLISLTNRSEVQSLANYELSLYEEKIRNYLQAVEMNIQKLKKTGNVADLPSLPDHPSLSDRFMKEYWKEVDKQPSTSSESSSELADSECLICLANMESSDETIKCDNCRRRFHSKCASEWFKVKRVCPACSRGLLDPSEFPSLG